MYAAGLTLFTWRSLTDFSVRDVFVLSIFSPRNHIRGGFRSPVQFPPRHRQHCEGMVLSSFLCIVAVVGAIYTSPGWPTDGILWILYGGTLKLSSIGLALAGIISALIFGALTGFLWDRFRGKELTEKEGVGQYCWSASFWGSNSDYICRGISSRCGYWGGFSNTAWILVVRPACLRWLSFSDSPALFSPTSPGGRREWTSPGLNGAWLEGCLWH